MNVYLLEWLHDCELLPLAVFRTQQQAQHYAENLFGEHDWEVIDHYGIPQHQAVLGPEEWMLVTRLQMLGNDPAG